MKATERKELQTNALKQFGQDLMHGGKRLPSIYWVLPLMVLVVWLVYYFWSGIAATRTTHVWANFWAARGAQDAETENRLKGTVAELSWKFEKADRLYQQGYGSLFTIPQEGIKDLKAASALYEEVAQAPTVSPLMALEAYSGAAKAEESLGEVERAAFFYKTLLQRFGADRSWSSVDLLPAQANQGRVVIPEDAWVHPVVREAWHAYERLSREGDERRTFAAKWLGEQLQMKRDRMPPLAPGDRPMVPPILGQ